MNSEEPSVSTSSSSNASISSALNQIRDKISDAQDTLNRLDEVTEKSKSLQALEPAAPLDIDDLVALDRAHQHLAWLDVISKVLAKAKNVDLLIGNHRILVAIVNQLMDSACLHLRSYAVQSLIYLRSCHIPTLEAELESNLESLNYPKCVLGLDESQYHHQESKNVEKFQKTYSILQEIQLPEKILKQFELTNVDPAMVVAKPLKKRFKFHFMGAKKTNNPDKPEWYLQQVGNWLKLSKKFFNLFVPNGDDETDFERFSSAICSQILKKLQKDIVTAMYDDVILSHTIDEILTFSQEFHQLGVDENILPLIVLLEPEVFKKWLTLERKFAFAKIDDMMLDENTWTSAESRQDVSKCTETFVVLLQSITNRFKLLNTTEQ